VPFLIGLHMTVGGTPPLELPELLLELLAPLDVPLLDALLLEAPPAPPIPLDIPELVVADPAPDAPTPPPAPVSSPPDPPVPVLVTPDVSPHAADRLTKVTAQAQFWSLLVVA